VACGDPGGQAGEDRGASTRRTARQPGRRPVRAAVRPHRDKRDEAAPVTPGPFVQSTVDGDSVGEL